ncbi:MAG: TIGR00299 family protein [Deltaproteobacteria bacterium RBG_16_49_23]|nr:MAG: TIGR00299 family protein [Deltaproteobacteria bacterium RBG_16_49_23]
MKVAYFDCFSGASGDMILGSMIDAGLSSRGLREELKKLRLPHVFLKVRKVLKGGISATQVIVEGQDEKRHSRSLKEIFQILDRGRLESEVKEKSREVFERIASVEAKIHRRPPEEIHFHEIGGLDSVVDIVGAVWGFRQLEIDKLYVSRVNVGTGFVRCEHGILPVPAPATLSLMKGKPIYSSGVEKELLTPTGAALLTSLGSEFGKMPGMRVEKIGYGAGRDDLPHPNLLRLIIGREEAVAGKEKVMVVETNIDDMNPQFYDYVMERLFGMEVQEVFLTPILMKKNRPATLLTTICPGEKLSSVIDFLISETTTLGLRWREEERSCADREILSLRTRYGKLRFKLAKWEGKMANLSPEYEDCKRLALNQGISIKEVFEEAKRTGMIFREGRYKNQKPRRRQNRPSP